MTRTIDPTATPDALPVVGADSRAAILRGYRIAVYADRWEALRRAWAGRGRELARDAVATVIVEAAPPVDVPAGVCGFPGCGRPRAKREPLCHGHAMQKRRRGGLASLTPIRKTAERSPDTDRCRACGGCDWRRSPCGKRSCRCCERARWRAKARARRATA